MIPLRRGVLCFLLFFTLVAQAGDISWIPKGRRFPLTFADPREIRMAMLFDGANRIRAVVGNYFNLLGVDVSSATEGLVDPQDEKLFVGIEGSGNFSLRQGPSGAFPLETMDGLFGLYCEMNRAEWHYQLRLTHISAHLGDGLSGVPIKYSRESLIARAGYSPTNGLHVYGGISNLIHSQPALPVWGLQAGGHLFFPWHLGRLTPFTAADIQWRDEAEVAKWSVNFHLGIALNDPAEPYHSFRFFYNYYSGADPRGQFLNRPFTAHSLAVEMQI